MKIQPIFMLGLLLLTVSCKKDDPKPEPEKSLIGWASGRLYFSDPDITKGVIVRTTDGGKTWVSQSAPEQFPDINFHSAYAYSEEVCWVAGIQEDAAHTRPGIIYKTTDGGKTWFRQGEQVHFKGGTFKLISIDGVHLWAIGEKDVYISADAGETWETIPVCTESDERFAAQSIATYDGVNIYAGGIFYDSDEAYRAVAYSTDGGRNWSVKTLADSWAIIDVSTPSSSVVYMAGGHDYSAKTTNITQNLTMYNMQIGMFDMNGVYALDMKRVWFVGDHANIFYTTDGGDNWRKSKHFNGNGANALMKVCFLQDGLRGVIASTPLAAGSDSPGELLYTSDGGETWNPAPIDVAGEWDGLSMVQSNRK